MLATLVIEQAPTFNEDDEASSDAARHSHWRWATEHIIDSPLNGAAKHFAPPSSCAFPTQLDPFSKFHFESDDNGPLSD